MLTNEWLTNAIETIRVFAVATYSVRRKCTPPKSVNFDYIDEYPDKWGINDRFIYHIDDSGQCHRHPYNFTAHMAIHIITQRMKGR